MDGSGVCGMTYLTSEQMRNQLTIQTNTPTRGTSGAEVDSWADTVTVWTRKAHKNSREYFAAQKVNSETTDLFIIRYRTGVTTKNRVKYGSSYYDIVGANDPDGRKKEIHLLCKEVL